MSLHFLPLHCRFSSLHFLEDSFIRIPFPFRPCIFLQLGFSPAPSSFSCNALTCISFTSSHSCFLSAPCFASPACIASSASSGMMLAMLGVLSSIRHPPKILVFGLVFGCCGEMLQKSPKPIRESFAPYKGGPSPKRTRMVGAWSAHGPRMVGGMGRAALYLKVSPTRLWPAARSRPVAGFKGCRPVPPTSPTVMMIMMTMHPLHLQSALTGLLNRV